MDLHFDTIAQIGGKLRSGETSSVAITELMLDRISGTHEQLNAFITVTDALAREQAHTADNELRSGRDRGPLHGIPVAIKDLFATRGIRTTCGSRLFENWIPDHDAAVVVRLREAGAVLLGKTGMHELAYGPTSINPFFGAVRNPLAPDRDAGGSSGGSASAVAGGLAFAAIGTDTGCSIRQPAHCCGIVGHKPTFGLVSKAGGFPLVRTMDHVGPIARSVEDAALVLSAIAGHDPTDPYSANGPANVQFDADGGSVEGTRIGIVREHFFEGYPDVIDVAEGAIQSLADRGAQVVELEIGDIEEAMSAAGTTFVEALAIHRDNLEQRPDAFGDDVRTLLVNSIETTAADYIEAQHFRRGFIARMDALMSECDFLVAPTATITASLIDERPDDYSRNAWKNTLLFNFTGQPSISIPGGMTGNDLPAGLMITGRRFEDEKVLKFARAAEDGLIAHA